MSVEWASGAQVRAGDALSIVAVAMRRRAFVLVIALTVGGLAAWLATLLATDGLGLVDLGLVVAFLIYEPWHALGFWNSLLGFALLHGTRDMLGRVIPPAVQAHDDDPIVLRTAIVMTVRNEPPARPFAHLRATMESVTAADPDAAIDYHILSDSSDPAVIAAEEQAFAAWHAALAVPSRLNYRRRADNVGFKGGNVHEFCERCIDRYDLLIPLDADSLMSGAMIMRLIRIMQANPQLGILQTLAVGLPTTNPFGRIFQFGHRHGMRAFVAGAGWWQAERCQFWGHNAAVRLRPFTEDCRLPILSGAPPLGGRIICHDQVEAVLMHRAGYEVRLLPQEGGSYEGNPPTLPDYLQRNDRWCQGNIQNLRLFDLPGISLLSRFHLGFMAQKFIGAAAMLAFVTLAALACVLWPAEIAVPTRGFGALYALWLVLYFSPKLLGVTDALLREKTRYGGAGRLLLGALIETMFILLLAPVSSFAAAHSLIMLALGHSVSWGGQQRDGHRITWRGAWRSLWLPSAYGFGLLALLAFGAPGALAWFLPYLAGLVLAVPGAVLTASPALGAWLARHRLCATPEELAPPPEVAAVLPVLHGPA
ncbi:MAG TPA: glucans biosynthesis glucosyltransferase MdoH [Candidatus Sulfotelmatobacter sp.]|nr:glucans biosynthesis glucosyltransferase MdoH [Candidatus Sulfotelmatobacter sp.]